MLIFTTIAFFISVGMSASGSENRNPFSDHEANRKKERQESIFNCAATYFIWLKISEEKQETDQARTYSEKYRRLLKEAEKSFEESEKTESETVAHLQRYVDKLLDRAGKDGRILPTYRMFCDKEFL
ncbi:hypothetical protein [Rhizobium hainanense]|nr:hypothetical protein [Rhizobium hainanense]